MYNDPSDGKQYGRPSYKDAKEKLGGEKWSWLVTLERDYDRLGIAVKDEALSKAQKSIGNSLTELSETYTGSKFEA